MNIDEIKSHPGEYARLQYRLRNASVYVSPDGFHFTDYLDPVEGITPLYRPPSSVMATDLQADAPCAR